MVYDEKTLEQRYSAPPRVAPTCDVWACDRDAYSVLEMYGGARQLCAEHWCRFYLVLMLFLGDAHAKDAWQAMCEAVGNEVGRGAGGVLGVGPGAIPATVVSAPLEWRCAICGGSQMQGPRDHYHHRCGGPVRADLEHMSEGARIAARNHDRAAETVAGGDL